MFRIHQFLRNLYLPRVSDLWNNVVNWFYDSSLTWSMSASIHMLLLLGASLVLNQVVNRSYEEPSNIEVIQQDEPPLPDVARFELGDAPLEPTELSTETLEMNEALPISQLEQKNDDSPIFEERGGGTSSGADTGAGLGFDLEASGRGPTLLGGGGVDTGLGMGMNAGRGGAGNGFGLRGSGMRAGIPGVTRGSERAVAAALNWLARHQNQDGSWSMDYGGGARCKDQDCARTMAIQSDPAATALALLPFLASGQTHEVKGPYQKGISRGLTWLVRNQKSDGDLSDGTHQMYAHGLAAIALCEAYGMTQDSQIGMAAQKAIDFTQNSQNDQGGWRYRPREEIGDTSVFGWQVMALKSGQMAGLKVDPKVMKRSRRWLKTVRSGRYGELFAYTSDGNPRPSMTAVGLLTTQYLGAKRSDSVIEEGVGHLMSNLPSMEEYDTYYWYYATQVMHNVPGPAWERWNRVMRRMLIETQIAKGCAAGSWDPDPDRWGMQGGRLMVTSLSALTLEVYYRYLPLYQLDVDEVSKKPAFKP